MRKRINMSHLEAVIWDFGGVVTSSPFEAFNRYEADRGFPCDTIRRINAAEPDSNAWALFERAEIDAATFDTMFAEEAARIGHAIRGNEVLALLSGDIRPRMVAALDTIKAAGHKVGCITNNVPAGHGAGMARSGDTQDAYEQVFARFEHVIESSKAGVRKPDPRIYLMMCEMLGLEPGLAVGLILVACCPGGTASNVVTYLAGANVTLAFDLANVRGDYR